MSDLLKEAIADAKAVRETALANARMALEEAFQPQLQSMLSAKLREDEDFDEEDGEMDYEEEPSEDEEEVAVEQDEFSDEEDLEDEDIEEGEDEMDIEDEDEMDIEEDEIDDEEMDIEDELDLESIVKELELELDGDDEEMDDEDEEMDYEDEDDEMDYEDEDEEYDLDESLFEDDEMDYEDEGEEYDLDESLFEVEEEFEDEEELEEEDDAYDDSVEGEENPDHIKDLKEELREHKKAVRFLRDKLHEVNILNAKLLFTNKLFKEFTLDNNQKLRVVETFDRAQTTREIKIVYSTLVEGFKDSKIGRRSRIKESASTRTGSTRPSKGTRKVITEEARVADRFKFLAGINKK